MSGDEQSLCSCARKVIKVAAVVAVACVFFIVIHQTTISVTKASFTGHIVPIIQEVKKSFISHTSRLNFSNFAQVLAARADSDRYIILAMTDEGYFDLAMNLYETSLRAHQLDNFLFVGLGRNTCEIIRSMSIPCFYYADDQNAGEASIFGLPSFHRKMRARNNMIIDALAANFTVIHCDTDLVFIHNPVPHIKVNKYIARNCIVCSYVTNDVM